MGGDGGGVGIAAPALSGESSVAASGGDSGSHEMVVACCRFLCYFCRTSRQNQKAMFDHLLFILDNANILLSRPSLRGSTPLDVAYSSLMDNTELALALREQYLEKIAVYLSRSEPHYQLHFSNTDHIQAFIFLHSNFMLFWFCPV